MKVRGLLTRRFGRLAALFSLITVNSCGGSSPSTPTPTLAAPTLASPSDDAIAVKPAVLEVNNVAPLTSDASPRTYEFQVATSQTALTSGTGLFASQAGVAEGANGHTAYTLDRDLQVATRYYWRARAVQGSVQGQWSSVFRFRTDAATNTPPVIQSVTAASARNETNAEIQISAVVQDQETSPDNLTYEWSASGGSFSGTGPTVRWRAPAVSGPTLATVTLTVIERYTATDADGRQDMRENRVMASTQVHVNDSTNEVTVLATTFIDDFIHSDRSAAVCVRNFSDNCPGKQAEFNDITNDRAIFVINSGASGMGAGTITFYADSSRRTAVAPGASTYAVWQARCTFTSTRKSTGVTGTTSGTCELTTVYENWQWYLCDSHFLNPTSSVTGFSVMPTTPGLGPIRRHHP
jgi:hypothetical protein